MNTVHDKVPALGISILCFSKNRPFQLDQFLLSCEKHLSPPLSCNIHVIYRSDDKYENLYEQVFARHSNVEVSSDSADDDVFSFAHRLQEYLDSFKKKRLLDQSYLCFCVDDMIFTHDVDLMYVVNIHLLVSH